MGVAPHRVGHYLGHAQTQALPSGSFRPRERNDSSSTDSKGSGKERLDRRGAGRRCEKHSLTVGKAGREGTKLSPGQPCKPRRGWKEPRAPEGAGKPEGCSGSSWGDRQRDLERCREQTEVSTGKRARNGLAWELPFCKVRAGGGPLQGPAEPSSSVPASGQTPTNHLEFSPVTAARPFLFGPSNLCWTVYCGPGTGHLSRLTCFPQQCDEPGPSFPRHTEELRRGEARRPPLRAGPGSFMPTPVFAVPLASVLQLFCVLPVNPGLSLTYHLCITFPVPTKKMAYNCRPPKLV